MRFPSLSRAVRGLLPVLWLAFATLAHGAGASPDIRLYVLDCGRLDFQDLGMFDDSGALDGKPGSMSAPCFLIRHPKGLLLWDTGLGDAIADRPGGVAVAPGIRATVPVRLVDQLRTLGLAPSDIDYLAFSHWHEDHTGNANLFGKATWIMQRKELAAATGHTPPPFESLAPVSAWRVAPKRIIDGDTDVFGDGSVRILSMPGHTPGHQVLELRLSRAGVVLLAGDLYHSRENRRFRRVPRVNTDRAQTLASMDRFEAIAARTHAWVVIPHDSRDIAALPRFPSYLH
ncbi:N-acyl homoserine lactonase family protein [Frateuria terrea]|uniref:Glyoxylase, beta-lactamase superfamily II n=1 Tax=Frateuria terrea TaxID=529704 RepID=A0A1H6R4Q9_9GAMM|nr:N-acyl homoserine lactonase family protein [Frateuria terrea]SEI50723.1 Glyoxylase, beta-lactamase superfamily II [Frateuria terrea]SFP15726.1 Glyoxylase, beta-lactamase superfamily II [Frateuria terrea]